VKRVKTLNAIEFIDCRGERLGLARKFEESFFYLTTVRLERQNNRGYFSVVFPIAAKRIILTRVTSHHSPEVWLAILVKSARSESDKLSFVCWLMIKTS
jgi:hypothetical protein